MRDTPYPITAREFGIRVAVVMDTLRSSAVFFILQQAFPEESGDLEWSDYQDIMNRVINERNDER